MIEFGRFMLDPKRRILFANGRPIELQSRTFEILVLLVAARDRVVARDDIIAQVWQGQIVAESNLTVQMSILRRALAEHDASALIITVPGRGYRFVGDVTETAKAAVAATAAGETESAKPEQRRFMSTRARFLTAFLGGAALFFASAVVWRRIATGPLEMTALVRIAVEPDEIRIEPGKERPVDYVFTVENQVDLQLETEDFQFSLPSGEPIGLTVKGSRIWGGSFPIRGGKTRTYHNNIYLPPGVAEAGKTRGSGIVQLKHVFHLRDALGKETTVPAVLMIGVGP
jgi:DNA-binding winged helix-turn-helix (wHTH) protein